jgi:hypothetical protein
MYARKNSTEKASAWSKEEAYDYSYAGIVSGGKVALCLDGNDKPHIACKVAGMIIYTRKTGASWISEIVDSTTQSPGRTAIAIDGLGRINIAYAGDGGNLKFARKE